MKFFLLIPALTIITNSIAQPAHFNWVKGIQGKGDKAGGYVKIDSKNNVIVVGEFRDYLISQGNYNIPNMGSNDIFLIKYDPIGNVLWFKAFGGSLWDFPYGMTIDSHNNIIITGCFLSPLLKIGSYNFKNPEQTFDAFITKYSPDGQLLLAKQFRSNYSEVAYGIATDVQNNIYITGTFDAPLIIFGSDTLYSSALLKGENFLLKYDEFGNEIWARSFGGDGDDVENCKISIDNDNNIYIYGVYAGRYFKIGNDTLQNSSKDFMHRNLYLAKLTNSGEVIWTKSIGNGGDEYSSEINIDNNSNVYISGIFNGSTLAFGNEVLINIDTPSYNLFLAKFSSNGEDLWAKSFRANTHGVIPCPFTIDNDNNIFFGGLFYSQNIQIGNFEFKNKGTINFFVGMLDSNSNIIWAKSFGGNYADFVFDLTADHDNSLYITGGFLSDSINFDNISFKKNEGENSDDYDYYLLKLGKNSVSTNNYGRFELDIFPNPVNSFIKINRDAFSDKNNTTIKLIDILGSQIPVMGTWDRNVYLINTQSYSNGVYILEAKEGNRSFYQKIIIQH